MTARKPRPESKSPADRAQEREVRNREHMDEIRSRVGISVPRFYLGQTVILCRHHAKPVGIISGIFVDYTTAVKFFNVGDGWYESLPVAPTTPKTGLFWYSILLPCGAILQGELDLLSGMDVSLLAAVAKEVLGGKP
jgi:hypothetical protein